ncbi:MAG TPA: GNVR domain-containing protein [Puia sp.]|jgi:capsular exopolysaccharide synthesis family protein|nr:GNVR domain-containing protein [Puia sp.]
MDPNNQPRHPGFHSGKSFNKKMILPAILRNWFWFLLAGGLGFGVAFILHKAFPGSYRSTMTILLINSPHQVPFHSSLDNNLEIQESPINVQDEQTVVSAYSLQLQTLQNLNWRTRWYKKSFIGKRDIYKEDPYIVSFPDDSVLKNAELLITPLSATRYRVECDHKDRVADTDRIIRFTTTADFGQPFINNWFRFTLYPATPAVPVNGTQYVLVFNDLNFLAIEYQGAMEVKIVAPESDVLNVDLKGENVLRNVDYLNELGNTYLKFGLDQKNQSAINTLNFIRSQISGVADSLRTSGDRYTDFRTRNKVVDLTTEGAMVLQKVEDLDRQENLLKLKMDYYNGLNRHLNEGDSLKSFVAPPLGDPDPDLSANVQKLSSLYSQRTALSLSVQPKNPKMIAVGDDISLTQKLIQNNIGSHLAATRDQIQSLELQKKENNDRLTNIPATERSFLDIKRGFDVNSTMYNFLLQKRAEAGIALASNNPDAKILDPATIPTTGPIGLKPVISAAIGVILGMLITLGIVLLKQYTNDRLREPEEATAALHLSVAGLIPHNRLKTELPVTQHPHSEITESFRNLRTNLRLLMKEGNTAMIAVHSATSGEGKSFIAANLASLLALGSKRALLIQADKHNTHLEELVGAQPRKDLTEYLEGTATFSELLTSTEIPGLSFIRGSQPETPLSELMDTPNMEKFVREARAAFGFIIVDTPPISILSDARIMANYADINLFVLRIGYSTIKELSFINQTAEEETVKNMITVLNDTPPTRKKLKKALYFKD